MLILTTDCWSGCALDMTKKKMRTQWSENKDEADESKAGRSGYGPEATWSVRCDMHPRGGVCIGLFFVIVECW